MNGNGISQLFELMLLIIIFVIVLWMTYTVTKKLASIKRSNGFQKNMKIIEVLPLNQHQYIYIIKVGQTYHLLTSSKEGVNYGCLLNEAELEISEQQPQSFNIHKEQWKQKIQERKDESK